jgi:hypothetical protein
MCVVRHGCCQVHGNTSMFSTSPFTNMFVQEPTRCCSTVWWMRPAQMRLGQVWLVVRHLVTLGVALAVCFSVCVRTGWNAARSGHSLSAHRPPSVCTWAACVVHPGCQVCGVMSKGQQDTTQGRSPKGFSYLALPSCSWAAMHVGEVPVVLHGQGVPAAGIGRALH